MTRRVAGIDIGGTKVLGVALDADDAVAADAHRPTPEGAEAIVGVLAEVATSLGPVERVGIGAAGLVDAQGVLRAAPNLPGVFEVALRDRLQAALGMGVHVENDATCATAAEWRLGAGGGHADLVFVALGTGIGAGFVVGGELQRGANGFAGEPGHMIVDPDGVLCVCGQRGCWERYASGSGLAMLAGGAVSAEEVEAAGRAGDPEALAILDRFAWWIALGLVNLVNLLDPSLVVLGGGVSRTLDLVIEPIRGYLAELIYAPDHRCLPEVVPAALGERAGAIGAALLARDL